MPRTSRNPHKARQIALQRVDAKLYYPWLDALRSGRYGRSKGRMRGDGGYCPLGVLLDVYNPDGWVRLSDGWYYGIGDDREGLCDSLLSAEMQGALFWRARASGEIKPDAFHACVPFSVRKDVLALARGCRITAFAAELAPDEGGLLSLADLADAGMDHGLAAALIDSLGLDYFFGKPRFLARNNSSTKGSNVAGTISHVFT